MKHVSAFLKDWRLPTLAEAIQPLPSALQCLTAVFGMGTGRTTAVMPPKCLCTGCLGMATRAICRKLCRTNVKERLRSGFGGSLKTTHRGEKAGHTIRELKLFFLKGKSNQAARPISTGQLNASRRLHSQPIKRVVCPWSLGALRHGKHYLGRSLALRCFQRLSLPHMATQRCP
jgi:hypothetical protein